MTITALTGVPAFADNGGRHGDPAPGDVQIFAEVQYGTPPGKHGGDGNGCHWTAVGEAQSYDTLVIAAITYNKFVRTCPTTTTTLWIPQLPPASLAAHATNRVQQLLPHPTINTAPTLDQGIANLAMWIWATPAQFQRVSAFAWLPTPTGITSALATATPQRLTYTPGEPDSAPVTCAGPGQTWHPSDGDTATSSCMYTYHHSSEISPTDTFTATLAISWAITTRASDGTATTQQQQTATTQTATIREIQAVVTD